MVVSAVLLVSCASDPLIYPIYQGSHLPGKIPSLENNVAYVVWSNERGDQKAAAYITSLLLTMGSRGNRVVERARIQQVIEEQQFTLRSGSDREADLLQLGRLAGATQVIFIEIDQERQERASIRSVEVSSGYVYWSGLAYYPVHVQASDPVRLTAYAFQRAICPIQEYHYRWVEEPHRWGRCLPPPEGISPRRYDR